uniref:Uncharacterized protein n=1 Tax=Rhizophagus irregularis (strain DAOM 181602 / DAOM 197198 / MUCL 43194) TaxID=747089 RepID=U9UIC1_RHIID
MIASEMGVAAQVEGASAIESAIIGISEEEAVSALVAYYIFTGILNAEFS